MILGRNIILRDPGSGLVVLLIDTRGGILHMGTDVKSIGLLHWGAVVGGGVGDALVTKMLEATEDE